MTLSLSPKYKTANSHYLNVSSLSDFPDEREYLIAGESIMAIVNIYTPSFNEWDGHEQCIKAILYWERITEQDNHTKNDYNYGIINENNKQFWMEIQTQYLVPLLKYQIDKDMFNEQNQTTANIAKYIHELFNHFCDNKSSINFSCIDEEIIYMDIMIMSMRSMKML